MPSPRIAVSLAVVLCIALSLARADAEAPAWLVLRAGTIARVDVASWPVFDEPEAALTASADSLERDFSADLSRPNDVVYEPVGVRVRVVRVFAAAGVALVHAAPGAWEAYAPIDRMFPEVPPGTVLRTAGGFEGFADFFTSLDTPERDAGQLATGTELVVLGMGAAPYDPASGDLVRMHVRVRTGDRRGSVGWITAGFAGLPLASVPPGSDEAAKACGCRILRFERT